jgi:hypothetical protein
MTSKLEELAKWFEAGGGFPPRGKTVAQHHTAAAQTIREAMGLVKAAYAEGWGDAADACTANVAFDSDVETDWAASNALRALTEGA